MTIANRIYLDSAPVIYYLDKKEPYKSAVSAVIQEGILSYAQFFSSTLLNTEYLVVPYRLGNAEKIADFYNFKQLLRLETQVATDEITVTAAKLRTKYKGLKGMDAIHLATAIFLQCDMFLTNDKQLAQLKVQLLDTILEQEKI